VNVQDHLLICSDVQCQFGLWHVYMVMITYHTCKVVRDVVCVDCCRKLSCALLILSSELNSQVNTLTLHSIDI